MLYWIVVSFGTMNHSLVAVGFGFATLPRAQRQRLRMGPNDFDNDREDESFPTESKEKSSWKRQRKHPRARMKKSTSSTYSTLLPPPLIGKVSSRRRWVASNDSQRDDDGVPASSDDSGSVVAQKADRTSQTTDATRKIIQRRGGRPRRGRRPRSELNKRQSESTSTASKSDKSYLPPPSSKITGDQIASLPEWGVLSDSSPPPDFLSITPTSFPTPAIEGVLPVSELFYRSTQSISSIADEDDESESGSANQAGRKRRRGKSYKNAETNGETGDDEELPFSAEQSDRLSTPGNKIQIRRNEAADSSLLLDEIAFATGIGIGLDGNRVPSEAVRRELKSMAKQEQAEQQQLGRLKQQHNIERVEAVPEGYSNETENEKSTSDASPKSAKFNKKKLKVIKGDRAPGRKMVRRGMEMLVGGEPINADPPQRAIEMNYFHKHPRLWNRAITLNSPDFGPFLHMHSAGKISKKEIGLYCENFVHNAQKWNICPEDLKDIVTENELGIRNDNAAAAHASSVDLYTREETTDDIRSAIQSSLAMEGLEANFEEGKIYDDMGRTIMFNPRELEPPKGFGMANPRDIKKKRDSRGGASGIASDKPVRSIELPSKATEIKRDHALENVPDDSKIMFTLGAEFKFS